MALDQTQNFVEVDITGTYTSTDTTISLESGGASEVPDPANGEYNLVWFDAENNAKPSFDPEVEIVRVTGRDTGNDTLTVQRGQENTSAVAHDTSDADYKFLLTPTSKMISDIDNANFETNSLTVAGNNVALGNSTAVDHSDLSNINPGDHHTRYTDENAQDAVGTILTNAFNYSDATPEISFVPGNVDVTNFDGSSGTSGQFLQTDGTNLTFADVTGGMTVQERQAFNDLVAQMARNDFADNLSEMAYDGGLYDVWRDTSKVASQTDVNIKTLDGGDSNGVVELAKFTVTTDGFESGSLTDGDPFTWTVTEGTDGSVAIQQTTVKNGSNAVEVQGDGTEYARIELNPNQSVEDGDIFSAWVQPSTINNDDADIRAGNIGLSNGADFAYDNNTGSDLLRIRFNLSVQKVEYQTQDSSGNQLAQGNIISGSDYSDNWFRLEMEIRPSQSEADFRVYDNTDTLLGEVTNVSTSGETSFDGCGIGVWSDTNDQCFVDDARLDFNEGVGDFVESGNVVSVTKDLSLDENGGFTSAPSSVVISQRATLPTDTDLQYVVRDGNGNTVTVAQSEVDTEVDTSALTSTTVEVELQLSQSATNDDVTPTSDDFMAHFKE